MLAGDKIGVQLGFPTANLQVTGLALPPNGVYAARTRWRDQIYRVALNIGLRPTVASALPELRVEAHLLDFTGNLYGEELELDIIAKLRDEQRFASLEALRQQIAHDVAAVRQAT